MLYQFYLLSLLIPTIYCSEYGYVEKGSSSCNKYAKLEDKCLDSVDDVSGEVCVFLRCNSWPEYSCSPMSGCEPLSYAESICSTRSYYTCTYPSTASIDSNLTLNSNNNNNNNNTLKPYGNPAQVSLGFYYDYFASRNVNINALAVGAGVETVFGGNVGNGPISIPGAATSMRLKPASLCTNSAECVTTDNAIKYLQTYNYVHIDEISSQNPCPECAGVIEAVGNAGYAGRIIVFFRYGTSGSGLSSQTSVVKLGMSGYLRKIFFETYPDNASGCSSYICTSTSSSACSKLITWKSDFATYFSGSNILFAPTFGLRSGIDLNVCSQDMSALTSYFSCMHNSANGLTDWKGAAFFGASDCTGCSSYSISDAASHCGGLLSWWNGK